MADIDNRGQVHMSESESFLRDRIKALEARITSLEIELSNAKDSTSTVEFDYEKYIRESSKGKVLIL